LSQYLSICYAGRLSDAGIKPSVGSVGYPCDNTLTETVIDLPVQEESHQKKGPSLALARRV
jgi:transposase InsO family protein